MKVCLRCGDTYRDHVDFCFVDGEVLQFAAPASDTAVPNAPTAPIPPVPSAPPADAPAPSAAPSSAGALDVTDAPAPPARDADIAPLSAAEISLEAEGIGVAASGPAPTEPPPPASAPTGTDPVDPAAPVAAAPTTASPGPAPVRTTTPVMTSRPLAAGKPPVIQRIEVVRTPTEFARAGDGPTPLEVPRHVVRIDADPDETYEYEPAPEPASRDPLLLGGAALLAIVATTAFTAMFWAFDEGQQAAEPEPPHTVTGTPGPFLTDPPGANVFLLEPSTDGGPTVTRFLGKTNWNGVRFSVPSAEQHVFRVVLDGWCTKDVVWSGLEDGLPVRIELNQPPCEEDVPTERMDDQTDSQPYYVGAALAVEPVPEP